MGRWRRWKNLRVISQVFFFIAFFVLLWQARYPLEGPFPMDLFLRLDPLLGILLSLGARTLMLSFGISLIVIALSLVFGRAFCGWVCPMGTALDVSDRLMKAQSRGNNTNTRWWKFAILGILVVAALLSYQGLWLLDPLVLLDRTATAVILPVFWFLVKGVFEALFGVPALEGPAFDLYSSLEGSIIPLAQPLLLHTMPILIFFAGVLALEKIHRRFWCRSLCPLGALLGLIGHRAPFQRLVTPECNDCSLCREHCKMGAIHGDFRHTNRADCILCLNCALDCPKDAITYGFSGLKHSPAAFDLNRRRLIGAAVAGVVTVPVIKATRTAGQLSARALRPPGAVPEEEFLDRCIRCQECVQVCSSTGGCLQPSLLETGWEGFWSPIANMKAGYCEYECNLCAKVCPSGAIHEITLEDKKTRRMGRAYFDRNRCIPFDRLEDCLVCEEHCPTPEKAILFDIKEVQRPDGSTAVVKFPYVRLDRCIGCGICEYICPLPGEPGIYCTREGEERWGAPTKVIIPSDPYSTQ
jgi:polyferredoxin/Pyruvate/2-oxoacid:ferredoxin oxidoreductase delta subunit